MTGLSSPLLVLIFIGASAVTWVAGVGLSKTTDALDVRLGFGQELGGIILLAIAGSLPEVAITISAAADGNLQLAAGNLIGGIAVQTMVLVLCDFVVGPERPLTFLVGALTPVLEGLLVVLVVSGVLMGALLPPSTAIGGRRQPGVGRNRGDLDGRDLRDQPRAEGPSLERLDARKPTGAAPSP